MFVKSSIVKNLGLVIIFSSIEPKNKTLLLFVKVQKYFKSEKDKNNKFEENEDYF